MWGVMDGTEDTLKTNGIYTHEIVLEHKIEANQIYNAEVPIEFFPYETGLANLYQYVCAHFGVNRKETKHNWLLRFEGKDVNSTVTMTVFPTYVSIVSPTVDDYAYF